MMTLTQQSQQRRNRATSSMSLARGVTIWAVLIAFLFSSSVQAATFYYHNDHLGTPQVLTDENQAVVWQGEYSPFGDVTETVAVVEQNLRFPGQYYDQETELHYNYYRTYDPQTGRYVTSDPIGLGGGGSVPMGMLEVTPPVISTHLVWIV
jgi:RHS repeat-associated protein